MHTETQQLLAKVQAAGFDESEVAISVRRLTEMQIDADEVSLMRTTENLGVTLRGIRQGRYASVSLNQLDETSVADGIKALSAAANAAPVDKARQLAPDQGALKFSDGPAEANFEQMFDGISNVTTEVAKLYPDLKLEQSAVDHTYTSQWRANSKGLNAEQKQGYYNFSAMFSAKRGDKTSSFNFGGAQMENLKTPLLNWGTIRNNMESSIKELEHQPFDGKFVGAMMMTPDSMGELISPWLDHLSNDRLISGTSLFKEKMGQSIASGAFNLRIAPQDPAFAVKDFVTGDGYKSTPSTIIEKGVLKSWLLSDYGARKTGLERCTNSAANWVIDGGKETTDQLLSKIKRGIWLGRFSGGQPAANGDFSGVAKNSYLIENGKLTTPLSEVMISGNLFTMMQNIMGVSSDRINSGSTLLPWISVVGITVAGK